MIDIKNLNEIDKQLPPKTLAFTHVPESELLVELNEYLVSHPATRVRFFSNFGDWTNLAFLNNLPNVRRLVLQNSDIRSPITNLDQLRVIENLEQLTLQGLPKRRLSFDCLLEFQDTLELLSIATIGVAGTSLAEVFNELRALKSLGVSAIDCKHIADLPSLEFLGVGGGSIENLEEVPKTLKSLFVNNSRVASITELSKLSELESLVLAQLTKTGIRRLPPNLQVRHLHIEAFRSLESLDELETYSRIESLVFMKCHLSPSVFTVLHNLPTLQEVYCEFTSRRNEKLFKSMLPDHVTCLPVPKAMPNGLIP